MTRIDFNKGVMHLSKFFPSMDAPEETLDAWYSILKNWPVEVYNGCLYEIVHAKEAWFGNKNLVGMCETHRKKVVGRLLREREKEGRVLLPPRPDTSNSPEFKEFQEWKKKLISKATQEKKKACKARREAKGVLLNDKIQKAKEKWRQDAITLKAEEINNKKEERINA